MSKFGLSNSLLVFIYLLIFSSTSLNGAPKLKTTVALPIAGVAKDEQTPEAIVTTASLVGVEHPEPCQWIPVMQLTGFAPNSVITITNHYTETGCGDAEARDLSWTDTRGFFKTDANGSVQIGLLHGGWGTYNFVFSDEVGNSASLIVSYVDQTAEAGTTIAPLPEAIVTTASLERVEHPEPCQWIPVMQLTGFAPNSVITITNHYTETGCGETRARDLSWTDTRGFFKTDASGSVQISLLHGGWGTYNFVFSDEAGNSASLTVSYADQTAESGTTIASLPGAIVTAASLERVEHPEPCQWIPVMQLTGFAPNSVITITNHYTETDCGETQARDLSWTDTRGFFKTDANGSVQISLLHGGWGTYNFVFSDEVGHSASLTISYTSD